MKLLRRRWRESTLALVLIAMVAAAIARRSRDSVRPVDAPEIKVEIDEFGGEIARVDRAAMVRAFEARKLPPPPNFDRVDVVPVRIALAAVERWSKLGDGDALGALGSVYLAFENRVEAAQCFAAAAELGTQRERWLYLLGAACHSLQWVDGAVNALEQARLLDPRQALTHARLGDLYASQSRLPDALASFDTALKLDPSLSIAATGRARALLEVGDLNQALKSATQAARAQPRDFAARRALAEVLTKLGRHDEATREARVADQLPRYQGWATFDERLSEAMLVARVTKHIGEQLERALSRNDFARATVLCDELVARTPRQPSYLATQASVEAAAGNLAKAQAAIARALELEPNNVRHLFSKAEIELASNAPLAALATSEQALAMQPSSSSAYEILGRALFLAGRRSEGVDRMLQAVEMDPDSIHHRDMLYESLALDGRADALEALLADARKREATRAWAEQRTKPRAATPAETSNGERR